MSSVPLHPIYSKDATTVNLGDIFLPGDFIPKDIRNTQYHPFHIGSSSSIRSTTPPSDYPFDKILESFMMSPKKNINICTQLLTQFCLRQLITDGIAAALEAQADAMENADNPNRNTGPREVPVAKRGNYK
ncbi:hypothetical protein Tco_0694021 [Tanacetum coccineum]